MRIGILGGTFDPIHNGHLALAYAAKSKLGLNQVFFVPSRISPHSKPEKNTASLELRFQMVKVAVSGIAGFQASDVEICREGVSYSVDTLREFRRQFPKPDELFFLVGADWASRLHQWKEIDTIFQLCHVVVMSRPGFDLAGMPEQAMPMEFEPLNISSSHIREMIGRGETVDAFVPSGVKMLIEREHLYQL